MKILHTEWSEGLGGQEKRVLAEASGLLGRGHYVAIACRSRARIKKEAEKLGIAVHNISMRKLYDVASVIRLYSLLKDDKFDIVNTHSGVDSWLGGLAAKFAGNPLLIRTRHLNIPLKRNLLNFIHYLPDMYITCGENMRDNLIRQCGFPRSKVESIPTGTDPEFFEIVKKREAKSRYGLDIDSPIVTNVGILRRVKGHEVTLKAVKAVIESIPNARFLIVGDGPRKKALEGFVNDLGIAGHVIFTGFVENIHEIYSFSDVMILSSWSEGLPQSLLQAMAAGVPVVATNVGGVPEVVISETTGILVESGDHAALAKGIIRVLKDTELSSRLTGNAKKIAIEDYSLERMIDKIEDLYRKLLEQKRKIKDI